MSNPEIDWNGEIETDKGLLAHCVGVDVSGSRVIQVMDNDVGYWRMCREIAGSPNSFMPIDDDCIWFNIVNKPPERWVWSIADKIPPHNTRFVYRGSYESKQSALSAANRHVVECGLDGVLIMVGKLEAEGAGE